MTSTTASKQHRLTLRIPEMLQAKFEAAASTLGVSLNSFMVSVVAREATEVLAKERTIKLSPRDAEFISHIMETPPEPTAYALRAAADLRNRVEL